MRIIYSLIFCLFCSVVSAQFGVSAKYNSNSFSQWNDYFASDKQPVASDVYSTGYEFGVNYWRRLKNKRIEFLPEVSYSLFDSFEASYNESSTADFKLNSFNFNLPVHFYFLDLNSDCDCPTFSKQSDFLSKGLYFFINPGVSLNRQTISINAEPSTDYDYQYLSYRLGVGLGYDVGLSDLLTITPFVSYNYGFAYDSSPMNSFSEIICPSCNILNIENSTLTQIQLGVRFSFRPDYQSNNF